MSGTSMGRWVAAIIVVVLVSAFAGCIQGGQDEKDGAREDGVTLVIDFEGFEPETRPGTLSTWSPGDDGVWVLDTQDTGGDTVYTVNNVTGTTVLDVLLAAAEAAGLDVEHHQEGMGAFVDSIDGIENGRDDHHWSYYVNDEYGSIASDRANVADGDVVRWVYLGNPFG